jgi:Protein of unknown function (DUF2877)
MHLRLMATYLGVPYQAGLGPDGNQVTLFSPGPPPEELGFVAGPGHWRKQVSVADLGALWQSRPVGEYRDEPCLVLDDLGDRLHIAYLGRDAARAAQLGYWEIDREVFEVVVARHDVTGLVEERVNFPLAAATFPASGPAGAATGLAASGPAGAATGLAAETAEVAAPADPAGYGREAENGDEAAAGYADDTPGNAAGPPGYGAGPPGNAAGRPENGSGATENSQPEGYGADHASRMPDRVAAWHGSPAPEPWPARADQDGDGDGGRPGSGPRSGLRPARDPRPEIWAARDPGWVPPTGHEPGPGPCTEGEPWSGSRTEGEPGFAAGTAQARRAARKDRISPESVFAELLSLAAIPQAAYAVDEEVPGAMCLVETDDGFEVFSRTDNARLEVQFFQDEEAAYFYLFGVLAAEAIRSGRLAPSGPDRANGHHSGAGAPGRPAAMENISKYLRGRKLPNSASHPAIVYLAGGADGPPLPKQPRRSLKPEFTKGILRITNRFTCHYQSNVINFTAGRLVRSGPQPAGVAAAILPREEPGNVTYVTGPGGSGSRLAARARGGAAVAGASGLAGASEPGPTAAGVASLAVRELLRGPRRQGKVLAVLPDVAYLEFTEVVPEPRVLAISTPEAIRLPNAIITGPFQAGPSAECWAGEDRVMACGLDIRIVRWWDPSPVFGPVSRARLDHGCGVLAKLCAAAERAPGLAGHNGPARLAACCASGDLPGAVEAVEQLVGLGPGLVPSGDSVVSGVLLALRLLGGAISGGTRAVWLANWLSASATCYSAQRTTSLAAALLHCAAGGQAAAEVSAVLLGMAGQEPLEPAAARLLAAVQGADLAWGLVAGCRAALLLSVC